MRLLPEPTLARTGRRFTFQRRLVTLWAWLMLFPACGFLPQIAQICAIDFPTLRSNSEGLTAKGNFGAWCVKDRFYRSRGGLDNSYPRVPTRTAREPSRFRKRQSPAP